MISSKLVNASKDQPGQADPSQARELKPGINESQASGDGTFVSKAERVLEETFGKSCP